MSTIIMVDDDGVSAMEMQRLFKRRNALSQLVVYTNPLEALEVLRKDATNVRAIFSDMWMPLMDGCSFVEQVRQLDHCREIPIVFFTAQYVDEHRKNALKQGVREYLDKGANDTTARINAILDEVLCNAQP